MTWLEALARAPSARSAMLGLGVSAAVDSADSEGNVLEGHCGMSARAALPWRNCRRSMGPENPLPEKDTPLCDANLLAFTRHC